MKPAGEQGKSAECGTRVALRCNQNKRAQNMAGYGLAVLIDSDQASDFSGDAEEAS
jgi:hypothetical protein